MYTSGILSIPTDVHVDIFLVGAGGAGADANIDDGIIEYQYDVDYRYSGAGGAGGRTATLLNHPLSAGDYTVMIGAGGEHRDGGNTTIEINDTTILAANGGARGNMFRGGNGGSGGGCGRADMKDTGTDWKEISRRSDGAENGGNADGEYGGTGQGTPTRAFGDQDGVIYAYGGNGGVYDGGNGNSGAPNTGDGGDGGGVNFYTDEVYKGGAGGSGIAIIRFGGA